MTEECKIGVIGAGNMGGALISGLVAAGHIAPGQLTATDLRDTVLQPLRNLGVRTSTQAEDAILGQHVVVLGVKPQSAPALSAGMPVEGGNTSPPNHSSMSARRAGPALLSATASSIAAAHSGPPIPGASLSAPISRRRARRGSGPPGSVRRSRATRGSRGEKARASRRGRT